MLLYIPLIFLLSTSRGQVSIYSFHDTPMTWHQAKKKCEDDSQTLAEPKTATLNQKLLEFLEKSARREEVWVGAVMKHPSNDVKWLDNSTSTYSDWDTANGEPSRITGDECVRIVMVYKKWRNHPCNMKHEFVCQANREMRYALRELNKMPSTPSILPEIRLVSKIHCASACKNTPACKSFAFSQSTRMCSVYGNPLETLDKDLDSGYFFAESP